MMRALGWNSGSNFIILKKKFDVFNSAKKKKNFYSSKDNF